MIPAPRRIPLQPNDPNWPVLGGMKGWKFAPLAYRTPTATNMLYVTVAPGRSAALREHLERAGAQVVYGIVGLKTTVGRVSRAGVYPLSFSLDSVGVLARSVEDAAAVLGWLQQTGRI